VIIGVRTVDQLEANMAPADLDLPQSVWEDLEKKTRPAEEHMTWYNKFNHRRFFKASEFSDGKADLI
jgi:hypothetical protein